MWIQDSQVLCLLETGLVEGSKGVGLGSRTRGQVGGRETFGASLGRGAGGGGQLWA